MFMYSLGKWTCFHRGFYKKALMLFAWFTLLAGVVQLALGCYVYDKVCFVLDTWIRTQYK